MNRKRLISGLGIVLLCTSLIAYGADPPSLRMSSQRAVPSATAGEVLAVPANDECENAELVTGPYPVTVCGSNLEATDDCPSAFNQEAVWYEIELPYAVNKLVADYCATDFSLSSYSISTIYYNDCSDCNASVYGRYNWKDCGDGTGNPEIRWLDLPGPATVLLPIYLSPAADFCVEFNVTEIVQPANDDCADAEPITGPYPVTICGTNEGATVDCTGTFNQKAVWYEVTLPYAVNNMQADFCVADFSLSSYHVGTYYLNNCSGCSSPVNGSYVYKDCGDGSSNASVQWTEIPGPGTLMLPLYINPAHEYCFELSVTEVAQPDNDLCENAEPVTGPYPTTVCGTNQGATLDCPGVLDWNAVWYEVELPYAINTVETDYCPGEVNMQSDNIGIVYTTDCTCGAMAIGSYEWNDCGNYRANPSVWWRDVPGPGSILIPVWIEQAHEFCIEFNVRDGDCTVPCPAEGVAENELCGEDANGGCLMAVPNIDPITCGVPVCGTGWAEGGTRDTDWYEITITEPTTLTLTVESEFLAGVMAGLVETVTPGVVGCDQITGAVNPYTTAVDCEVLTVVYNAYPGTYWWFVSPDRYDGMPCAGGSNTYVATLTCDPWDARGACCDDTTGICTENVPFQDCLEPMRWGGLDSVCDDLSPPCGGCPESMIELEIFTDRYPSETTWEIKEVSSGTVVFSGGPYTESYTTYIEYCCVETNNCYELTVYDQAGDGQSWGNGGYAVRFDGAELCSTLESSWGGFESRCGNLGAACDAGRCCYAPWPGCADTTLLDCVSNYGGLWTEGRTCAADPCKDPESADFEVVAPYTSPLRDTCDDSLNRCHPVNQYYDTPEHVYRVTIPHDGVWSFNTCLDTTITTWLAVGTDLCLEDIGYGSWNCNNAAEVIAYLPAGDYYADVEHYSECGVYVFDVHEIPVCDVECPVDATPESEPCGQNTNDGCNGWPQDFEPITAGQTYCGKIYANNGQDNDWYEFVATKDDTMTWTVRANFACKMGLAEQYDPGVPGCSNYTWNINPSSLTSDCMETSVSFPVTAGGTYYVYVGHQEYNGSPCGTTNDYVATLTGSPCGDLDDDMDVDYDDYVIFLDAFGGVVDGNPPQDAECDYDESGAVGMADFDTWLSCYRAYVGDPLAGPPTIGKRRIRVPVSPLPKQGLSPVPSP